jgi:predicted nucleotidyltransferase
MLGTLVPTMGTSSASLFGETRSALLALLYGHIDESFYQRQLIRAIGAGHGAIQRELKQLADMGLIVRKLQGNQVLYHANTNSPIFAEIKSLITKTAGVHDAIRSALAPLESQIEVAFVFGSVARQEEGAKSDVDLMILGDVSFSDVVAAVARAQKTLAREINPNVFAVPEFRSKLAAGNHFLRSVMKEKKLFVLGSEHELKKLAAK